MNKLRRLNTESIVYVNIWKHYIVGFVSGSFLTTNGGAADPICLPSDPEWGIYKDRVEGYKAEVYGAVYKTNDFNNNFRGMHGHPVPCAMCLVRNRSVVKMFPGNI